MPNEVVESNFTELWISIDPKDEHFMGRVAHSFTVWTFDLTASLLKVALANPHDNWQVCEAWIYFGAMEIEQQNGEFNRHIESTRHRWLMVPPEQSFLPLNFPAPMLDGCNNFM